MHVCIEERKRNGLLRTQRIDLAMDDASVEYHQEHEDQEEELHGCLSLGLSRISSQLARAGS